MAGIYWNETEGLISLSSDGENWITIADKNLGATTVYNDGDVLSEANCGKYYQWGNNYGFPFTGDVTTSSTQVNANDYGPGNYYSSSTFIIGNKDWSRVQNDNLWGGVTGTVEAMQGPAPIGFHVPSVYENVELEDIMIALGIDINNGNCIKTYMKMPFAGYRHRSSAVINDKGNFAYYRSSSCTYNFAYNLYSFSNAIDPQTSSSRASGLSLRCFKNTPVVPDYNDTWETLYGDELPDRPEPPEPPKPKLKRIIKHNNYYFFGEKPTHASGITLNKNSITLNNTGDTEQLIATITPEDAVNKKVLWSSSDTSIATVSSTGLVTCVTPGECTITCTAVDGGVSASCSVTNSWQPGENTRLYLPLNSTDNFTDKSGNSYTVTNVGGVSFGIYQGVDCGLFNGGYGRMDSFDMESDTNWTISFFQYTLSNSVGFDTFADASNYGFGKSFKTGAGTNSSGLFRTEMFGKNGDGGITFTRQDPVETTYSGDRTLYNEWTHCVVTFEADGDLGTLKHYINGELVFMSVSNYQWYKMSSRTGMHVIGSDPYDGVGGRLFRGGLSNLVIEKKTWTAQEINEYLDPLKSLYGIS